MENCPLRIFLKIFHNSIIFLDQVKHSVPILCFGILCFIFCVWHTVLNLILLFYGTCEYLGEMEATLGVPSGPGDIGKSVASKTNKTRITLSKQETIGSCSQYQ